MSFFEKASQYAGLMMRGEPALLKELRETTVRELRYDDMLSGPVVGRFLHILVRISGARSVLEIGTFTGYASLWMATALPPDGSLVTCETNEKYAHIARRFFERYRNEMTEESCTDQKTPDAHTIYTDQKTPHSDAIHTPADTNRHGNGRRAEIRLCMGPALETPWPDQIDFVFLDADKEHYPEYYERVMPRLAPGGLLVVDNAFWGGKVWGCSSDMETYAADVPVASGVHGGERKTRDQDVPADQKTAAIDRLNRMIAEDENVENVVLTVRDGLHLVRKIR